MIRINDTNTVQNIGNLNSDLRVSGTNSKVVGSVLFGDDIQIELMGTNCSLYLGGSGRVSIHIGGTNCFAMVSPDIDASISNTGANASVHRYPIPNPDTIARELNNDNQYTSSFSNQEQITIDPEISVNITSSYSFTDNSSEKTKSSNKKEEKFPDICPSCNNKFEEEKSVSFCPFCGYDI